jgi:hypothetical protein
MAVNWTAQARKVALALKKDGQPIIVKTTEFSGGYDITTGSRVANNTVPYESHGIVKNLEATLDNDPQTFEIIFHSGMTPDTLPDMSQEKDVKIELESGESFDINKIVPVRPEKVTMMYKAYGVRI